MVSAMRPPKTYKRERDIEDDFVKFAATLNCVAEKLVTLGKRNFPDRSIFCPGGRLFFIEFKMPGEEPTPGQAKKIARLRAMGFTVHVCDNIEQAKQVLRDFLDVRDGDAPNTLPPALRKRPRGITVNYNGKPLGAL